MTLKKYNTLIAYFANSTSVDLDQYPVQRFNWFDEFGARVGLNRLYLEDNISFRFRILDTFKNPASSSIEGFKNALRRELNLWKAFGETPNEATPSEYYVGPATPEIMEIVDIENSLEYFNFDGSPKQKFKDLVRYLNEQYPVNWGYFRFNNAVWDIAGEYQEGVGRIQSQYHDDLNDFEYYQPGVGDFTDAKIIVRNNSATPEYFETKLVATGKRKTGVTPYHAPIEVEYDYYAEYEQLVYENQSATINLTLEATLLPYGNKIVNTEIYATKQFFVKNNYGPSSSASPEFFSFEIFDTEGYTTDQLVFKEKVNNNPLIVSVSGNNQTTRMPFTKLTNVVMKNGLWQGSEYASPNSDSFTAYFSHKNDPFTYNTTELNAATPAFNEDLSLKLVSNLYSQVPRTFTSSPIRDYLYLNDSLDNTQNPYVIDTENLHEKIIYPPGSSLKKIHIDVIPPINAIDSPDQTLENDISIYGGSAYDPEIDANVFIPASPNIQATIYGNASPTTAFGYIGSENGGATASYYFGKIEYSYEATPNYILISSVDSGKYPLTKINWEPFTAESSPSIYGYVDESGLMKYSDTQGEYVPGLNTNLLDIYEVTRESFGIEGSTKFDYFFEKIYAKDPSSVNVSIWSDQNVVKPFLNRTYVLESSIPAAIENTTSHSLSIDYPLDSIIESYDASRNTTVFSNIKVRGKLYDYKIDSHIMSGWVHLNKEDYYIYSNPVEETFNGKFFNITLSGKPKQGSPIIVDVYDSQATPVEYREIAFADQATPGSISFTNYEILSPKNNNSFYLGYKNLYEVSLKDTYTGEIIIEGATVNSNVFHVDESTKVLNPNRQYIVGYKLVDSYYVDTVNNNGQYVTEIVFDATPNTVGNNSYHITYEGSAYMQSTPLSIDMNPLTSSVDRGFIAIDFLDHNFSYVETVVSPGYILNDGKDYIDISIMSYDVNGNRKPYQTFDITSLALELSFARVTTDHEGYAHITATCPTSITVTEKTFADINIIGVNYSSDNTAHENSQSGNYSRSEKVEVIASYANENKKLYASVSNKIIRADGLSETYINGIVLQDNQPQAGVVVYWRKSDYLYSAFKEQNYSNSQSEPGSSLRTGATVTDSEGRFSVGPFISQSREFPGYWFVVLESELSTNINIENPQMVVGDVVYWLEDYDALNYNYVPSIGIPDLINYDITKTMDMYSTPSFIVSYYNNEIIDINPQSPRWIPPKWFSTSRYTQYQSGLFGATPYYIKDYSLIIKDYEEE